MPPSLPPIRAASATDLSLFRPLLRADSCCLHRPLSWALLRLAIPPVTAGPLQPCLSFLPFKRRPAASSALLPPSALTGTTPPPLRSSSAGSTPPHYPLASPSHADKSNSRLLWMKRGHQRSEGILGLLQQSRQHKFGSSQVIKVDLPYGSRHLVPYALRTLASSSSTSSSGGTKSEKKKDIMASEDPFDAPTYNIPEKPVTFAEGASYSVVILVGLGVAAAAAYGVFKELIFEPKEYKIFGKALERVQSDSQVRVRIGSPVTGYGQESMNRAARQRIPNRAWTDEDGTERIEVNFYIRGPHGAGKVYTEMFKDSVDKQWKYTYLIVEIKSPSQAQLMLESYVPA